MESVRNLMAGYRMPDFSKLWRASEVGDDTDSSQRPQVPLLVRLEASLVRLQELALWIDPRSSIAAMGVVQVIYWYLAWTSSTILNLTAWACILGFVYTTWVNRIWPEITVEKPSEEESTWTPVRPEVFSAPELVQFSCAIREKCAHAMDYLRQMRTHSPGKFCACACAAFAVIGYIGAYVTALGLFYYSLMGFLTVPGLLRYLGQNNPAVRQHLESFSYLFKVAEEDVPDSPVAQVESEPSSVAAVAAPVISAVYKTVQTQISSVVSHLTSSSVLAANESGRDKSDEEDELKEYLPEVKDEQDQQILEVVARNHDAEQANEDESLEYSSLLVGLGPSMPDVEDDEVDRGRRDLPRISLDTTVDTTEALSPITPTGSSHDEDDDDDFLPSVDPRCNQLLLEELDRQDDDEDEVASIGLMSPVLSTNQRTDRSAFPGVDESDDVDRDDYEFFSGDELAEALIKK